MNPITQTEAGIAAGYTAAANYDKAQGSGTKAAGSAREASASESTSVKKHKVTNGKTIGEPQLSEQAQKYYDQLRKKYSNMDFILVSSDMKEMAKANAGKYANKNRMVVLIDEEKIEKMATDEEFRKQYEGIIGSATKQLPQIKKSLGVNAGSVKSYGIQVNDGGNASFFAVIDKSLAAQRDRIEKRAQHRAEEKKKNQKAEADKRAEERRTQKADAKKKADKTDGEDDTVTVTADSIEDLIRQINSTIFDIRSQYVQTDQERQIGQHFDAKW